MLHCGDASKKKTVITSCYYWVEIHSLLLMKLRNSTKLNWAKSSPYANHSSDEARTQNPSISGESITLFVMQTCMAKLVKLQSKNQGWNMSWVKFLSFGESSQIRWSTYEVTLTIFKPIPPKSLKIFNLFNFYFWCHAKIFQQSEKWIPKTKKIVQLPFLISIFISFPFQNRYQNMYHFLQWTRWHHTRCPIKRDFIVLIKGFCKFGTLGTF